MAKTLADFVAAARSKVREISAEEARAILEAPGRDGWHFVDVREPDEFAAGHIPGAHLYPRGFLEVRADLEHPKRDAWLKDRSRPLVLYCGGGRIADSGSGVQRALGRNAESASDAGILVLTRPIPIRA